MGDNDKLQKLLDAPLATSRGGEEEKGRERKRPPESVEIDLNSRGGYQQNKRHSGSSNGRLGPRQYSRGPPPPPPRYQHRGPPRQEYRAERYPPPPPQRFSEGRRRAEGRRSSRPPDSDETHFKYKWTLTADEVQILTVMAFGTELVTVSSTGNLRLDANGLRTFRVFQALNMCLQPLQLKLVADKQADAPPSAGFGGGDWKLKHLKHGWSQDFVDGVKLSAFPNRDWKRILPKLKALPQSVVFSYETENI